MRPGDLTITVDVERLKAQLAQNRAAHGAAYDKARAGYISVTTQQLQDYITRLANGELLERAYIPGPPEDHTGDYDDALAMMDWAQDPTIELSQQQFRQYVQDDWGWKDSWVVSNTEYITAASQ